MDVGVRDLKQRLSELLERASRGEVIRVMDRGRPKAILGPLPGLNRLTLGIEEGWIRAGATSQPARMARFDARRRTADSLDEDRGT